jgi:alkylation response protein AidB-like acyl-CoA dehydrogenase
MTTGRTTAGRMTTGRRPATAGEAGYRELVRQAVDAFDAATKAGWHAARHVPPSALAALGAMGVFEGRWEPGAYGGIGRLTELVTELQRCDSGLALAAIGHSEVFIGALIRHGRTDGQTRLLREAVAGGAIGCFAATEPQGGASLAAIAAAAERTAHGWHLAGVKRYVSNVGSATHAVVLARADPGPSDLSLFVVPLDAPGVSIDGFFDTSGVQSCDVGQLSLDVGLPADALLGRRGLGLLYASHLLQFERLAISALLLGAAEQSLALATAYARSRQLAGARVMDKQVIRHRLAKAHAELWNLQSRLADIVAFSQRESAVPAHEISALKLIAGQRVTEIIDMSMQVLGARGNTTSYPLERLWRDCRVARIGGGTDEVLADTVASFIDRPDPRSQALLEQAEQADLPRADIRF